MTRRDQWGSDHRLYDDALALQSPSTEVVDQARRHSDTGPGRRTPATPFRMTAFVGADLFGCRNLDDLRTELAGGLSGRDGG
ncbi:hypothetical protein [Nocardioides sp. NPDC004968]|uniref:hypothetical protein n=1 Tax=Nocardioides sp. NPDC004968 TaxID=3155894 RepID=UPI0033B01B25